MRKSGCLKTPEQFSFASVAPERFNIPKCKASCKKRFLTVLYGDKYSRYARTLSALMRG